MRTVRITRVNGKLVMLLEREGQPIHVIPMNLSYVEDWIDDGQAPTYFLKFET